MIKNKYSQNSDDIFLRYIIAGVSEELSNTISYVQIEDKNTTKEYKVPVLLAATGQERFLQYYFSDKNYEVCQNKIEGSYDVVPRGVIKMDGNGLVTSNNTSPYSRGDFFEIDDNGYIRMYNANIEGVPINLTMTFEITTNSQGEQWKIWQSLIQNLYYSKKFKFIFQGAIVPCMISFPDKIELNNLIEFVSGHDKDKKILRTSLDIETYLPLITDKRFKGNRIEKFITTQQPKNDPEKETTELEYTGTIVGKLTYIEDDSPLTGTLTLTNANDEDNSNDLTATLEDGYFSFRQVKARTGYILKDSDGNVIERKIHLTPGETERVDLSLYKI